MLDNAQVVCEPATRTDVDPPIRDNAPSVAYGLNGRLFKLNRHGGARPGAGRKPTAPPLPPSTEPHWRCVRTFPHEELTADIEIRLAGFPVFAPTLYHPPEPARRSGTGIRSAKPGRVTPLFPRYLFVRFALADCWQRVRFLPGVTAILSSGVDRPLVVPPQAIEAIRAMCGPLDCVQPSRASLRPFAKGDGARLTEGPMAGLAGICERSSRERVTMLLSLMGREVRVTVPVASVEAA